MQGSDHGVHHEIELVKASLLYADTVEVLSLGNQMVREINNFAGGDGHSMWALLGSLDDETLRHLGPDLDVDTFRQILPLLTTDPAAIRALAGRTRRWRRSTSSPTCSTRAKSKPTPAWRRCAMTEKMRDESGVAELQTVLDQKLVRFNENVIIGDDTDAVIASFIDELKRYLQDPQKFVLLMPRWLPSPDR